MSAPTRLSEATTCSQGEGGEAGLCQLGGQWVRVGLGPGWRFGCGTGEGSGSGTRGSGVGVCVRRLVPICTSAVFWSSQVGCGKVCSV